MIIIIKKIVVIIIIISIIITIMKTLGNTKKIEKIVIVVECNTFEKRKLGSSYSLKYDVSCSQKKRV